MSCQPPSDGLVGRPIRRTASELPTGQNVRRPDVGDHAATRLAQLSNIGGGATVRLSTVGDDDDDEEEEAAKERKPVKDAIAAPQHWGVIDSDRSFLGNGKQFWLIVVFFATVLSLSIQINKLVVFLAGAARSLYTDIDDMSSCLRSGGDMHCNLVIMLLVTALLGYNAHTRWTLIFSSKNAS